MKDLNIIIVGAGGTASYLTPVLARFQCANLRIHVMDGDTLEKRNIDRQLFKEDEIGVNKAQALAQKYGLKFIPEYLTVNNPRSVLIKSPDVMFCLVDNDQARKDAYDLAMANEIAFIVAVNEMFDASARIVLPEWHETDRCLYKQNPEIKHPSQGGSINCTGRIAEEFPQLAIANSMAASLALHLFFTHIIEDYSKEIAFDHLPYYISRTPTEFKIKNGNTDKFPEL